MYLQLFGWASNRRGCNEDASVPILLKRSRLEGDHQIRYLTDFGGMQGRFARAGWQVWRLAGFRVLARDVIDCLLSRSASSDNQTVIPLESINPVLNV